MTTPNPKRAEEQTGVVICKPHHWVFVHDPRSVPTSYKQCSLCSQLDCSEAIAELVREAEKAYGGCHKCYGKGYATVRDGTIAYADFYGDKTHKSSITNHMRFCTCDRGKQLEALLQPKGQVKP